MASRFPKKSRPDESGTSSGSHSQTFMSPDKLEFNNQDRKKLISDIVFYLLTQVWCKTIVKNIFFKFLFLQISWVNHL